MGHKKIYPYTYETHKQFFNKEYAKYILYKQKNIFEKLKVLIFLGYTLDGISRLVRLRKTQDVVFEGMKEFGLIPQNMTKKEFDNEQKKRKHKIKKIFDEFFTYEYFVEKKLTLGNPNIKEFKTKIIGIIEGTIRPFENQYRKYLKQFRKDRRENKFDFAISKNN